MNPAVPARHLAVRATLALAAALTAPIASSPAAVVSPVVAINAEAKSATITVTPIRGPLYLLEGSGGNVTVLRTPRGLLLVDGGISLSKPRMAAALRRLSPAAPKYLINTHYHWDHTDGNGWLHARGAIIIAQENTLKHLSEDTRVDDWEWTFPASSIAARPTVLVSQSKTLHFHGTTVALSYYGPSHTDSDLWAYFVEPDVLATGDTWWNGYYPFIDNEHGGSIDCMIRAANANLAKVGEHTIVVPGHGPIGGRAELTAYRDMLVAVRDKVASLKRAGKSRDEVVAARPTAEYDAKWGGFVLDGPFFTRIAYDGL